MWVGGGTRGARDSAIMVLSDPFLFPVGKQKPAYYLVSKTYLQLWFPTLGSHEPLAPLSSVSIKTGLMKTTNDLLGAKPNGHFLDFIICNLGLVRGV